MDAATQSLGCDQKSPHLELKTQYGIEMNVKTLTHSQQQPQGPKAHKQKSTIRLTYRTVFCVLQRSPLYRFLVLDEVKCKTKTHTQHENSVNENHLRAVNLTENYAKNIVKLLAVALRMYLQKTY